MENLSRASTVELFTRKIVLSAVPRRPYQFDPSEVSAQLPAAPAGRRRQRHAHLRRAADAPGHGANASTPIAASGYLRSESWRMFYHILLRSLRFRQNTRSTPRYIEAANAASLRARKQEEQARNEGRTEQGSPVPERELTDFERAMANARDGTATATSSTRDGGASSTAEPSAMTPKGSYKTLDRMSGLLSTDPQGAPLGQRKHFVPVFLYLTFQKTANLYFLLVGIFQIITSVSPTDGVPPQLIPLAIVIVIDAIVAGYEDYKRHMADDLTNSAKTRVFNRQLREFEEVEWRELKVGDFVKVANHDILPADIMILAVIPAEGARCGGNMGLWYVEVHEEPRR
ncbi:hypothetical protein PF004_g13197 [Phytophthora fragariae]|uniref:P-type ATPase N-terminal domain-containing protein n=1 Tax=Phytophthora fragariae TaxID=53985 RepID=A0A6G0NSZ1_9STRA|nr:hypothetical protein PF004_g13197 [Phytophthora fragariae]